MLDEGVGLVSEGDGEINRENGKGREMECRKYKMRTEREKGRNMFRVSRG